jgi:hypothetical protein
VSMPRRRRRAMRLLFPVIALCALPALLGAGRGSGTSAGTPTLADPSKFEVKLYADLSKFGRLKAFQLKLSDGKHGFRRGLYLTSGPSSDDRSNRLVFIDKRGTPTIARSGFASNETMVFAQGKYGKGLLVAEPLKQRIVRIVRGQRAQVFANIGTPPFGPAGLVYGPDRNLYVTDFSGAKVLRVDAKGNGRVFATVPVPDLGLGYVVGPKGSFGGGDAGGGGAGGTWLVSTFTAGPQRTGSGAIYRISARGRLLKAVFKGMDGIELIAPGPGGPFGKRLFVPTTGGSANGDGGLYTVDTKKGGNARAFLTGIDAVSVVFDTKGVLGGGMFVSDINDNQGAGKVWWVRPKG